MPSPLPLRHFLLALAVVAVWGINFVVIKFALGALPPLLMAALRFGLVLLPGLFFCARPAVPLGNLALYGFLIGWRPVRPALRGDERPHLAGPGLAGDPGAGVLHHRPGDAHERRKACVASSGWPCCSPPAASPSSSCIPTAAPRRWACCWCCWRRWPGPAATSRRSRERRPTCWPMWCGPAPSPCRRCSALSLLVEGREAASAALHTADAAAWAAVAWQAWGNSLFGYAAWGWLLARHPAATITPMAMLVPVFGMGAAALWLDESLPPWKLIAAALVLAGLALNLLWPRLRAVLAGRH
jgi:O-acetylserine/cysteine efflux transporter